MEKLYKVILILVLLMNVIMGIVVFQLSAKLTIYEHIISHVAAQVEDVDDAMEEDVVPRLEKILKEE
ncbi:hypothetical protein ACOJQI_11215 [Bacillus salacetis]|uniref:hypothetical protein n=1 Tax=Bacillus salacetis TaxID=2315464 RepID=UPI003B9ECDB3